MMTIQKRVFKMAGVEKLLEQNVENRDCMYKYDEPFKKMNITTNKNMDTLNDSESKINQTGRENWGQFLLEFEKCDVICVPAKKN